MLEEKLQTDMDRGYFICEGIYKDCAVHGQYKSLFNFYN